MPNLEKLRKNINAYKLVVNAYIVDSSLIEILRLKKIQVYTFESAECTENLTLPNFKTKKYIFI